MSEGSAMNRTAFKQVLFVALAVGALACGRAALAQTVINTTPPDPLVTSLRDRVDALEAQVRTLTGENEQLTFQLQRAKDDNVRLQRTIDDMNAQAAPPPAAPSAAPSGPSNSPEAAQAYLDAYEFIKKSDFPGAETAFRSYLASYPNSAKAPDARYFLGQTLLQRGASSDAAEQFLTIVKKTPKAERAPDAMVRLGVALNRMGEKTQACATLQALPTQYPKASASVKATATAQIKAIGC
jgi:tol-pal system protein YbgF